MARRGWVAAEVGAGDWRRLSVFDDGWVELPGMARLADTRGRLRRLLLGLVLLAFLFGLSSLLGVAGVPAGVADPVGTVAAVLGLLVLVVLGVQVARWRWRDIYQRAGDVDQARRERVEGRQLRRAPGAPLWRRARDAATLAAWLEGEVHVPATAVVEVQARREERDHVVEVRLGDGTTRRYRSPDRALPRLLLGFGPGAAGPAGEAGREQGGGTRG